MKICFFTLGSRGDVQPYIYLGQRLIREGHQAVICTGESFREIIENAGVEFCPSTSDLMAFAETQEGKAILAKPLQNAALAYRISRTILNPAYRKTLDDFYNASKGADVIVYHPKALGAVDIALARGIKCVSMPPVPITWPVEEFPNLALFPNGSLGRHLNRLSYRVNAVAEKGQIKEINDFRRKTLGLTIRKAGLYAFTDGVNEIPTVYPLSPALFPDVKSWDGHVFLPGFFFSQETLNLDEPLRRFIDDGTPPIAVSFSSMNLRYPERFIRILREALTISGHRAVVLTGNSGMVGKTDDQICFVPAAPHTTLFPLCLGVLHHGGIGTTAAVLHAGVPQIIMPLSTDQPFWADRLHRLGLVPKGLKEKNLSSESLAKRFTEMEQDDRRRRAKDFQVQLSLEDGTQAAVRYLESIFQNGNVPVNGQ